MVILKSIIKMAFANLKRKKLQSLLIGIIIMASALIFTTSLGILASMNSPFEQMYKKLNASHLLLVFDKNMHNPEDIASWWKNQKEVESVSSITSCVEVDNPLKDNKKVETQFFMAEMTPSVAVQDKLLVVDGAKKTSPGQNEIWIPTALAYSQNLKVGDELDIPLPDGKKQLTISARRSAPSSSRWVPNAWRSVCGCTSAESPRRMAMRLTMRPTLRVVSRASTAGLPRPRSCRFTNSAGVVRGFLPAGCGQARGAFREISRSAWPPHRPEERSAASCPLPRTRIASFAQ